LQPACIYLTAHILYNELQKRETKKILYIPALIV
jgi:hypothetical protein